LLARLAPVLEITTDEIRQSLGEDYRDRLARANEPIRPYVVVRYLACVNYRIELPCEPYAMIGGKRVQFDFDGSYVLRPIDEPSR
jgi:hypothetical protein